MPNWCSNYLQIKGNAEDLNKFKEENAPAEEKGGALSFDRAVPMPKEFLATDAWYHWRIKHWGTKWDVNSDCDGSRIHDNDDPALLDYTLETAWAPPVAWLRAVSEKYPDLTFHMAWVEGGCCFSGEVVANKAEDQWDETNTDTDPKNEDYRRIYELVYGCTDGLDPETEEVTATPNQQ